MSESFMTGPILVRLLCACCGLETLHRGNVCIQCGTIIVFPSEQRKVKISKKARRLIMLMDEKHARKRVKKAHKPVTA